MNKELGGKRVLVNARGLGKSMAGVSRYTHEITSRLQGLIVPIRPIIPLQGFIGQAWDQLVLPIRTSRHMLWSPANLGPIFKGQQVVTIHDLAPIEHPEWFSRGFVAAHRIILPPLVKKVRTILVPSVFTKDRLIDRFGLDESKLIVTPLGSNLAASTKGPPTEKRFALFVGSIEPRKNLGRAIQAWLGIPEEIRAGTRFVIAGAHGSEAVFGAGAALQVQDSSISFLGRVTEQTLEQLYATAMFLVFPSLYEGFGLPVVEAGRHGTPSITSIGTPMARNMQTACLQIDPHSVTDLADAMVRLLQDDKLRIQLGRRARERSQDFNWDITAALTRVALTT